MQPLAIWLIVLSFCVVDARVDYISEGGVYPDLRYWHLGSAVALRGVVDLGSFVDHDRVKEFSHGHISTRFVSKMHLSRVYSHACDYVLVSDDPRNCVVKPGCTYVNHVMLEKHTFSTNVFLCKGTPEDYDREVSVARFELESATMYKSPLGGSLFFEERPDLAEIAYSVDNKYIYPRACVSDIDDIKYRQGRIVGGKYVFITSKGIAYNCTNEYLDKLNRFVAGDDVAPVSATTQFVQISPGLATNVMKNAQIGADASFVGGVTFYMDRLRRNTGTHRHCFDVATQEGFSSLDDMVSQNRAMYFNKEYMLVNRSGQPTRVLELCLTHLVVPDTEEKLPVVYHEDAWYERIVNYIVTAIESVVPRFFKKVINLVLDAVASGVAFVFDLTVSTILDHAWMTVFVALMLCVIVVWCAASLKGMYVKLTSPGINVSVEPEIIRMLDRSTASSTRTKRRRNIIRDGER